MPREPIALFGSWLQGLRQWRYAIGELRQRLHAAHRAIPAGTAQAFSRVQAEWMKWLPQPATAEAPIGVPHFPGLAEGIQVAIEVAMRENRHVA